MRCSFFEFIHIQQTRAIIVSIRIIQQEKRCEFRGEKKWLSFFNFVNVDSYFVCVCVCISGIWSAK